MTKILAPLSSTFVNRHPGDLSHVALAKGESRDPASVFPEDEKRWIPARPAGYARRGQARDDERTRARVPQGDLHEQLMSSVARSITRRDEYLIEGRAVHEVHLCVEEGASCSMGSVYRAHEKEADLVVRFFVTLEKNATFSLDIASFLLGERSKSDVRVFLVLNEGARATVRQLTRAEGHMSAVHEEIRGLSIGEYAHASFIPELELLHDDILATHAASIVRVDEARIAYLLARGVSREDAVGCLAQGFLGVGGPASGRMNGV